MNTARRLLLMCIAPVALVAQSDPHQVQPERPTVATHAGTVAPGWLEIESGAEFDRYSPTVSGVLVPTVFKFGLAPQAQLSIFAPLQKPSSSSSTGLGDVTVGVKWRLADDVPLLGDFAVLPAVKFPTGSTTSGTGTGTTDLSLLLISSHMLGDVALDINAGYTRRNGDGAIAPTSATIWTVSTGGPAAGDLGWVAELFGFPGTSGQAGQAPIVGALFGPTYSIRPWLAIDGGFISPVSGPMAHAVYFGGVWNVGRIVH